MGDDDSETTSADMALKKTSSSSSSASASPKLFCTVSEKLSKSVEAINSPNNNSKRIVNRTKSADEAPERRQRSASCPKMIQAGQPEPVQKSQRGRVKIVFDPDDDIYIANACCECMHYRTSTAVVAVLEVCLLIAWCSVAIYCYCGVDSVRFSPSFFASQAVVGCFMLASIILLVAGVVFEKRSFVYPHLIVQALGIGVGLGLTLTAVFVMAVGNGASEVVFGFILGSHNLPVIEDNFGPIWPFCLAVLCDCAVAVGIWFYVLVKGYFDYLTDKMSFARETSKRNVVRQ